MIGVKIRLKPAPGARWRPILDAECDPSKPLTASAVEAAESDLLSLSFTPSSDPPPVIRVFVGTVIVASAIPADRAIPIDYSADSEADPPPLACQGRLLSDWVGITELVVQVRYGDVPHWHRLVTLPLAVASAKFTPDQFDKLFAELERTAAAVLLDVHGKTQLGLKTTAPLASSAPVAVLGGLRETVRELGAILHLIDRQPASRLRTTFTREQALVGQAVSDATLAEVARDPSMMARSGGTLVLREHLREQARPDYRIPEHRVIADFAEYLKAQLADLRERIDVEVEERTRRKGWRNRAKEPGKPTWWEAEDLPRIEELGRCRREMGRIRATVESWAALRYFQPGRPLNRKPPSTPLFRNHPQYRGAFRVIVRHFLAYQATLDTQPLMTRARSLPVLYEWWCAVQVIRVLSHGLRPLVHDPHIPSVISTKLAQEGKRFTIEFAQNQALNFADRCGSRVRFRYQPEYVSARGSGAPAFGVLDGALRTPDIAIEIYPAGRTQSEVPDIIIVLDAKYSSLPQAQKMAEVTTKYAKIGDARTGRVLSRQVWALTPSASQAGSAHDGLRRHCTVDNEAFWSPEFDATNPVNGAVEARPVASGAFEPLRALLTALLQLAGVAYDEQPTGPEPPIAGGVTDDHG